MRLKRVLSNYRKVLLGIALILSSLAISIRSSEGGVELVFRDYPVLIFFMVVLSSCLVALHVHINRKKVSALSQQIKELSTTSSEGRDAQLHALTDRQREVYDLIASGKTNKEIMAELFIEQSTLKTHINQIYRKLQINSRSEVKVNRQT